MSTSLPPRLPAGERLRRAGIGAWSIIGVLLLVAIAVWLLFVVRVIFPPLVLALLVIYVLNPVVSRLEQKRVPRVWGAIGTYLVVIVMLILLGTLVAPFLAKQVDAFRDRLPGLRLDAINSLEGLEDNVQDRFGFTIDTSTASCVLGADEFEGPEAPSHEECDEVTRRYREQLLERAEGATEVASSIAEVVLIFILAPLLGLYLLIDLPRLQKDVLDLVPDTMRAEVSDVGNKLGEAVGGYFRGQLFVATIVGILSCFGFWVIGLDFWLPIGVIAGFTNLIPLVGPFIGGTLGFLVGTITEGVDLGLKAALVAVAVQQLDNHFISPNVMRRTVQLHPVTVMLSLLAGGALAGFWGVLLAVPGVAVAKVLLGHIWSTRVLGISPETATATVEAVPTNEDSS